MNDTHNLRMMTLTALFAALIAAGAFIAVPIGPVPIVLQNFFVMLTALLLDRRWAMAAIGTYLAAGALGLPVFAGGAGGLGRFFGPTGGYLLAYLPAVYLIATLAGGPNRTITRQVTTLVAATVLIYALGVSWLKIVTGMGWPQAITAGMLPFLIGDGLKIAAAVAVSRAVMPVLQRTPVLEKGWR